LTLEEENGVLSRNVGKQLPVYTALHLRRQKALPTAPEA